MRPASTCTVHILHAERLYQVALHIAQAKRFIQDLKKARYLYLIKIKRTPLRTH
jgi:hypothetical protein